jgi:hypothetical protein
MTQPYEAPAPPRAPAAPRRPTDRERESERSVGWVVFAAAMLGTSGVLNTIYGIAAIASSRFYVAGATYVIGDLKTLGWIGAALGAAKIGASLGLLAFTAWARWLGVGAAAVNGVLQLLLIQGAPLLTAALLVSDILIVYGLLVHGKQWRAG